MMRPTGRGIVTLAIAFVAVALGWLFGARSLNAVAVPALVALLAGIVQVSLATDPSVERAPLSPAFPEETRTMSLSVEGGSTVVDVTDQVSEDATAEQPAATVAPPATVTYSLQYDRRGEHPVGPTTVRVRDLLGLFERHVAVDTGAVQVVYPPVYALSEGHALAQAIDLARTPDRQAFENVREYAPGDPLRNVHWPSSAKQPDELIVKEFSGSGSAGSITIAAAASEGAADEMAAATASVALALLDAGVAVDVYVPDDSVISDDVPVDRTSVLAMLARVTYGQVHEDVRRDADVFVEADRYGTVTVTIGTQETSFGDLQANRIERSRGRDGIKGVSAP